MAEGFVVMQIGNPDLEAICDKAIFPAIEASGLEPRRVDRNNEGDLLKSEIVRFLESSLIIIADLTNERPNCYLEVGYAMGLGKKKHLILTARSDHFPSHPDYAKNGKRVHFDLQGYDIIRWEPDRLDEFRDDLEVAITRRLSILKPAPDPGDFLPATPQGPDPEWVGQHHEAATLELGRVGFSGYWQTVASISPPGNWNQQQLRDAVAASLIETFGWPIGIHFEREGQQIVPRAGGISATVELTVADHGLNMAKLDHWALTRSGDFFYFRGLFEDSLGRTTELFGPTRAYQVTEMLLFLARVYGVQLGVSSDTRIDISMTLSGLAGRHLSAVTARAYDSFACPEDLVESSLSTTVSGLESALAENVKVLLEPVFMLFNFQSYPLRHYELWVNNFLQGKLR